MYCICNQGRKWECLRASPAAEQRGADSCVTDILGACSTPGIIMALIGRSVCGGKGMVNVDPYTTVCTQLCHCRKLLGRWHKDKPGALKCVVL